MKIADTSAQDVVLERKSSKSTYIIVGAIVLSLAVAAIYIFPAFNRWANSDTTVSTERLRIAEVTRGNFVRDLSVQGRVVAAVSPRLYSTAQGTITFNVDAGDTVDIGQVLAVIDSPELQNQLKQEESTQQELSMGLDRQKIQSKKQALENQKAVDLARVKLTAAEREKRRADKAYNSKSISQIDFEKAQDDLENAKLEYQHAVADAELNKESLVFEIQTRELQVERQSLLVQELSRKVDELNLKSPVNGIVGNLAAEQKNQVAANQAILSVVDLSVFELELQIPESYADDLAIGMLAEVNLNGETHLARLVTLSPEIENNQVTGRVRFTDQSPNGLRQNQRLTTRILLENKEDVLMVQRGQFLDSSNGRFAYKVKDGVAERVAIQTGARSLAKVQIMEGLQEGDAIIISSTEQFRGAQSVLLTN
jgi:HlyD family secretion protein